MSKRYKTRAELESKVIRISLGQYALLKEICRRASVTMTEALDLALKRHEPEPKPEPAQLPMIPVSFKPKSIESNGLKAAHFKPKSISGNGITHIKLKSIQEVR